MSNYIKELNELSFQEWFCNEFEIAELVEMVGVGPKSYPAFYHYADTSMLYERYTHEIWGLVGLLAQEYGRGSIIHALAEQAGSANICDPEDFADWMVCLAATYLSAQIAFQGGSEVYLEKTGEGK